jgi:crotonobetainyl-CoA:carnitine CoA-transferase CaiB-like acyl-CoA transferase
LYGIKVVEMGIWVAGPATAAVLGDWGAQVIKIENPAGGDPVRALMALGIPIVLPVNPSVELDNRNKRSVTVNVQTPEGRDVVHRLLRDADVFVSNLRAAALERAGLAYRDVRALNPRLIYASLSGYGTRGPDKDRAAFDYAAFWARAGAMATLGEPDQPPPSQRPAMGDHPAGLALAGAVCAALFHRERTDEGQEIHLSLFQAGMWMMATDIQTCLVTGLSAGPTGRAVPNPLWNHYRAGDGRWFHLVMLQADRYWADFCAAIERPDLLRRRDARPVGGALRSTQPRVGSRAEHRRRRPGPASPRSRRLRQDRAPQRGRDRSVAQPGRVQRHAEYDPPRSPRARRAHRGGAARTRVFVGRHRRAQGKRSDRLSRATGAPR